MLCLLIGDAGQAHGTVTQETVRNWLEQVEEHRWARNYPAAIAMGSRALEAARELKDAQLTAEAHHQLAVIAYFQEDFALARSHVEVGMSIVRINRLAQLEADLLAALGLIEWKQGRLEEATSRLRQALRIREADSAWTSMTSIANHLGIIEYSRRDYTTAIEFYRKALIWNSMTDNARLRAALLSNLAEALVHSGELEEAEGLLFQSLELEEILQDPHLHSLTYFNLGELRAAQNQPQQALELWHRALGIQDGIGNTWSSALTRLRMGALLYQQGQLEDSLLLLQRGITDAKGLNARTLIRDYVELLSRVHLESSNPAAGEFYAGLHEWLAAQPGDVPTAENTAPAARKSSGASNGMQPEGDADGALRALILIFLAVLICALLVENIRLRKLAARGNEAAPR